MLNLANGPGKNDKSFSIKNEVNPLVFFRFKTTFYEKLSKTHPEYISPPDDGKNLYISCYGCSAVRLCSDEPLGRDYNYCRN